MGLTYLLHLHNYGSVFAYVIIAISCLGLVLCFPASPFKEVLGHPFLSTSNRELRFFIICNLSNCAKYAIPKWNVKSNFPNIKPCFFLLSLGDVRWELLVFLFWWRTPLILPYHRQYQCIMASHCLLLERSFDSPPPWKWVRMQNRSWGKESMWNIPLLWGALYILCSELCLWNWTYWD